MKVLHIDDSKEICDLYKDMFTIDNHIITSVNDGNEGLKLVVKNDYDLILLDMIMPEYSGMNFLHDLKIQRPSELKKVVVVSVLAFNEEQMEELMEFGIHSVEEKPPNLQSLVNMQKNMLFK
jgi:CheY-like chemotaxis protein